MIKREIKRLNKEIEEAKKELKEWEIYNKKMNDVLRAEIKSLEGLRDAHKESLKKFQ
jgi:septal ring factor EnvC (AmiA/AmiB activator)